MSRKRNDDFNAAAVAILLVIAASVVFVIAGVPAWAMLLIGGFLVIGTILGLIAR
jgi:hypothetical protein